MREWKTWFIAAGKRAIKTMAQTAIATIGTACVLSDVNWIGLGSATLLAGLLSLCTSLAGLPEEDLYKLDEPEIYRFGEDYNDDI